MDRILRGSAATISIQFSVDEVDTDPTPDAATIEIVRSDGTELVAAGTPAFDEGTGRFSYTLDPADTLLLDRLTARWTAILSGYEQTTDTTVEIVGGFLCSLQQIADHLDRGGTSTDYALRLKQTARTVAETAIEQACGQAFTIRYESRLFDGSNGTDLLLPFPFARTIRSVSIDDAAFTPDELALVIPYPTEGVLYRAAQWGTGRRNIQVGWEHGQTPTPPDISRATALLAAHMLADGPWDDRGYGVTEDGAAFRLLTAGVSGAMFSIPEVEATVQRYRHPTIA